MYFITLHIQPGGVVSVTQLTAYLSSVPVENVLHQHSLSHLICCNVVSDDVVYRWQCVENIRSFSNLYSLTDFLAVCKEFHFYGSCYFSPFFCWFVCLLRLSLFQLLNNIPETNVQLVP